ncbi:uncharacterized protein ATNIH1004_000145 [Aspergillus tanneri]|uniref:Uncharacterized protein n=1 Tax=Aspergillus tanneri TaxID=1220188 RepID=A0A5M9N0Y2_9EURO|nr:uncharacterized protein ATNIH1004_000145 [Aspergillus tanneri]KAA8651264.1 hypothetical protein ATNIH1004_000145 [Aspergillus tanneri]
MSRETVAAEVLRRHADGWVKVFGPGATIPVPTWGVVIHGVPIRSMNPSPETMQRVATQLTAANQHTWGPSKNKAEGSIVVEFTNPAVANQAIDQGTIWNPVPSARLPFAKSGV